MNSIMRLPEFDKLSSIPSAQIPFVSSRAPDLIKDLLWGLRSGVDQMLIKRSMIRKGPNNRQRVLKSLDYVSEYRREATSINVEGWFSGRYIDAGNYVQILRERAGLDTWTLINVDIAAPANVSMILDLCGSEEQRIKNTTASAASPSIEITEPQQRLQTRVLC
jgi:hypothetical protein